MIGIRGAITVDENDRGAILDATGELVAALMERNALAVDDLVSAIFTMTEDLDAVFPAEAARLQGWSQVPLLCAREIAVPGALARCIRILIHAQTDRAPDEIHHVYLREAVKLRPDIRAPQ